MVDHLQPSSKRPEPPSVTTYRPLPDSRLDSVDFVVDHEERNERDEDPSDAIVEVREKFLAIHEPCDGKGVVPVETTGSPETECERAVEALRRALA